MKLKLDWAAFNAAIRTAGALMVGNVFVSAALLGNRNWSGLASLLLWGTIVIIVSSTARKG